MRRARWYLTYVGECPVCGKNCGWKEAKYTKPPPKQERYIHLPITECYDWCIV